MVQDKSLTARLRMWAQDATPQFVRYVSELMPAIKDALRHTEYDLGMPYVFWQSIEVGPGESTVLPVNCNQNGWVDSFLWSISDLGAAPVAQNVNCGITSISIASQAIYESVDGSFPRLNSGLFANVFGPGPNNQFGQQTPPSVFGLKRRIPIALGQVIEVRIENNGDDNRTYQVCFQVNAYRLGTND